MRQRKLEWLVCAVSTGELPGMTKKDIKQKNNLNSLK